MRRGVPCVRIHAHTRVLTRASMQACLYAQACMHMCVCVCVCVLREHAYANLTPKPFNPKFTLTSKTCEVAVTVVRGTSDALKGVQMH
jgi:hypothetical protein